MGNAELASLEVEEGSKAAKFLSHVDDACERASSLCRRMLAYAGKGEFVIRPIDIYEYLQRLSGLLRASIGQRVRLNIDVDKGLPPVMADQAQFQQVMINFIVNASDAIGDNAGEVSLIGKQVYKDNAALLKYYNGREMNEGEYVSLRVKDTGCGMDEKTRQRIFDPFFTTKSTGNGLGLSATLGIIQRHKGGVCVASEPGIGSEFEILMPIYEQTDIAREIITADTINMMANGAVLVVDDEKSLRDLAGSLLGRIGFNVLFAENGEMGVEMFRAHKDDLAVVLLDMTMPKLGGIDTMRMMREIDPAIPILLVSGYSEETIDQLSETDRPDGFVQKPFRFKELKKAMFGVL